jgi:hypothetical protein
MLQETCRRAGVTPLGLPTRRRTDGANVVCGVQRTELGSKESYKGTHVPLITREQFADVQSVFEGLNKPKYRKRKFAFRGLLTPAYDNCLVTAEIKKANYIYYHWTGYRGKYNLPNFREEVVLRCGAYALPRGIRRWRGARRLLLLGAFRSKAYRRPE